MRKYRGANYGLINWVIVIALALTWGTSFVLIKHSLMGLERFEVASLRIVITMTVLLPFVFIYRRRVTRARYPLLFLSGFLGSGLPAYLFATAQQHLPSSIAGVLNALTPVWALVLGILIFRHKTHLLQVLGVVLGFFGAMFLIANGKVQLDWEHLQYAFYIIIATACYGANLNLVRSKLSHVPPIAIVAYAFLLIGIPALIILISTGFFQRIGSAPAAQHAMLYISVLAIVGTAGASVVFYMLVQRTSTLFGAMTTYLIPVVAVFWGLFDGESVGWSHAIGLALVLMGVYFATRKKIKEKPVSETPLAK
jgi:drug/metabolite transporter (DMT)-like permease